MRFGRLVLCTFVLLTTWAASFSFANAPSEGTSPAEALSSIQAGNQRFINGQLTHPHQDVTTRAHLATGQKPHTILVSCSDSRVPPELVFDQGLGELFVVRVAGNILNAESVASIEYALEHLGSRLIVVMGHESCGAVTAALDTPRGKTAGSASLDQLVHNIRRHLHMNSVHRPGDKLIRGAVEENATETAQELMARSGIVREAINHHGVQLYSAVYSLATGKVDFYPVSNKNMAKEH